MTGNAVVTARGVSGVWKQVEGIRLHVHLGQGDPGEHVETMI